MASRNNRAQERLDAFNDIGSTPIGGGLEDIESLAPSNNNDVIQAPTAKIKKGKATAIALVSGALFGPLVGASMGLAQLATQKKRDQGLLDDMLAEQNILSNASSMEQESIDALRETSTGGHDTQQINQLQIQHDTITELQKSANPAHQATAARLREKLTSDITLMGREQEDQAIQQAVRDKNDARDLTNQQLTNYNTMKDDYMNESQPYVQVMNAVELGKKGLTSSDPAMLNIAMTMAVRALDPTSIISRGEKEDVSAMGDAIDLIKNMWGKLETGQQITDEQRVELDQAFNAIAEVATISQRRIDTRYQRDAESDLAAKYGMRFNLLGQAAQLVPLVIEGVNDGSVPAKTPTGADIPADTSAVAIPPVAQPVVAEQKPPRVPGFLDQIIQAGNQGSNANTRGRSHN